MPGRAETGNRWLRCYNRTDPTLSPEKKPLRIVLIMAANATSKRLIQLARELSSQVDGLSFGPPVAHVYNPLAYAWRAHEQYLRKFATGQRRVVLLGMNPGPFGMAQTGVPFGEIAAVRDWMGIQSQIDKPAHEHPKRPVQGFACERAEVSGRRLWGLFAERFSTADAFFRDHFVLNFCPLVFMDSGGRNLTPDKLPAGEAQPLFAACEEHLRGALEVLQPEWAIGIGAFAKGRLENVADGLELQLGQILHPSPASPAANRDWAGAATRQLEELGVW